MCLFTESDMMIYVECVLIKSGWLEFHALVLSLLGAFKSLSSSSILIICDTISVVYGMSPAHVCFYSKKQGFQMFLYTPTQKT